MNFGQAIEVLKEGKKVARKGWNGRGIFIELQVPDAHSKMTHPYIYIDTTGLQTDNVNAPKSRVPWLASQTDMLSEDWEVVDYTLQNKLYESPIAKQVILHPGEKVLTECGLLSLPYEGNLPQVRYEKSTYVGDVNTTETIEGTVEDVLKVISYSIEQLDAESKG